MKTLTQLNEDLIDNAGWVRKKILEFYSKFDEVTEKEIGDFLKESKITEESFYHCINNILTDFFRYGKYVAKVKVNDKIEINEKELDVGMRFEMEHTKCPLISRRIALDHLVDDEMYYTHLKEMEEKYQ